MHILSHRGWWHSPAEKNTFEALRRALSAGFGLETDVRDFGGRLVISHDPPEADVLGLEELLDVCAELPVPPPLALNIKADGLQPLLVSALDRCQTASHFVFDMSLPELLRYRALGVPYFTRLSDHEPVPLALDGAAGVWVDGFEQDWSDWGLLEQLLATDASRKLALVSPELHRRDKAAFWTALQSWLRTLPAGQRQRVMLCTDHPGEARDYFS